MPYTVEQLNSLDSQATANLIAGYSLEQLQALDREADANIQSQRIENRSGFFGSIKRGADQLEATMFGAVGLAGSALGVDSVKDFGIRGYQRNIAEAQERPKSVGLGDINSIKTALIWTQETLGELIPSIVMAAVGGFTGTLGAGYVAKKGVGKIVDKTAQVVFRKSIKKAVEGGIASEAGKKLVAKLGDVGARKLITEEVARGTALKLGGYVGMGASVLPMEAGGNYGELYTEHNVDAPWSSLATGAVAASLEFLGGNIALIDKIIPGAGGKLIRAIGKGDGGIVKRTVKEVASHMPMEAFQEAGQEFLSAINVVLNTDEKLLTREVGARVLESAAAGVLVGGAGGLVSGVMSKPTPIIPPPTIKDAAPIDTGAQVLKPMNEGLPLAGEVPSEPAPPSPPPAAPSEPAAIQFPETVPIPPPPPPSGPAPTLVSPSLEPLISPAEAASRSLEYGPAFMTPEERARQTIESRRRQKEAERTTEGKQIRAANYVEAQRRLREDAVRKTKMPADVRTALKKFITQYESEQAALPKEVPSDQEGEQRVRGVVGKGEEAGRPVQDVRGGGEAVAADRVLQKEEGITKPLALPLPRTPQEKVDEIGARIDQRKKRAAEIAGKFTGRPIVLSNQEGTRGTIIHKSTKTPGKFQVTWWDDRGFAGDTTLETVEAAVDDSLAGGFEKINSEALTAISKTRRFRKSPEALKLFQKYSAGGEPSGPVIEIAPVAKEAQPEPVVELKAVPKQKKERREFFGTRDRVDRGLMTAEAARAGEKPPAPKTEPINPADYAAELKGQGVDRQTSWSKWVQRTGLKPGMDAKDWYAIYDSVTAAAPVSEPTPKAEKTRTAPKGKDPWYERPEISAAMIDEDGNISMARDHAALEAHGYDPVKNGGFFVHKGGEKAVPHGLGEVKGAKNIDDGVFISIKDLDKHKGDFDAAEAEVRAASKKDTEQQNDRGKITRDDIHIEGTNREWLSDKEWEDILGFANIGYETDKRKTFKKSGQLILKYEGGEDSDVTYTFDSLTDEHGPAAELDVAVEPKANVDEIQKEINKLNGIIKRSAVEWNEDKTELVGLNKKAKANLAKRERLKAELEEAKKAKPFVGASAGVRQVGHTDIRKVKPRSSAGSGELVRLKNGKVYEYKGISGYAIDNKSRIKGWELIDDPEKPAPDEQPTAEVNPKDPVSEITSAKDKTVEVSGDRKYQFKTGAYVATKKEALAIVDEAIGTLPPADDFAEADITFGKPATYNKTKEIRVELAGKYTGLTLRGRVQSDGAVPEWRVDRPLDEPVKNEFGRMVDYETLDSGRTLKGVKKWATRYLQGKHEQHGKEFFEFTGAEGKATYKIKPTIAALEDFKEGIAKKLGKAKLYSTRQAPETGLGAITLKQIQALPIGKKTVTQNADGTFDVSFPNGKRFRVVSVDSIEDGIAFEVAYRRPRRKGEDIAGSYDPETHTVKVVKGVGDAWTVTHEFQHFLETSGLLSPAEIKALDHAADKVLGETGEEARARFVEQALHDRSVVRSSRVRNIIQKIRDLLDGFVNLFKTTARGVVRGLEKGTIQSRAGRDTASTEKEHARYSTREAKEATEKIRQGEKFENIQKEAADLWKRAKGIAGRGFVDNDQKWYHRAFGMPYWLGKKFESMKTAVNTEIKAAETRAKLIQGYYDDKFKLGDYDFKSLSEYQHIIGRDKEKSEAFENLIWENDRKRFDKNKVPENWFKEVVDAEGIAIELNDLHYKQVYKLLTERKIDPDVVDAFIALRRQYDQRWIDAHDLMLLESVDATDIEEFRASIGKLHNYFPHRRTGNAYIAIYDNRINKEDPEPATVFREHFNSWNKILNRPEQVQARTKKWLQDQLKAGKLTGTELDYTISNIEKVTELSEEVFFQISPTAMQQVVDAAAGRLKGEGAEDLRLALSNAVADVIKSRGWGRHAIQSKNIPGFETGDVWGITLDYMSGFAGFKTKITRASEHQKNLRTVDAKKQRHEYEYLTDYVRDMLSNQDRTDRAVDTLRGLFFVKYLGFVLKSGLVNLSQNVVLAAPVLSLHTKGAHRKLGRAMIDTRRALTSKEAFKMKEVSYPGLSARDMRAVKALHESGASIDQFLRELKGDLPGVGWSKYFKKGLDVAGLFMGMAEKFNRTSTGLAAFRIGMDEKGMKEAEAIEFAKTVIYDTHFLYGQMNLPSAFRGGDINKVLRSAYTFRTFTHNYLSAMIHLWRNEGWAGRKAVALSLRNVIIMGGLTSVPFFKVLSEALLSVLGDDDEDAMTLIRKQLPHEWMKDLVTFGLPGMGGFDITGSLSIEWPRNWADIIGVPYSIYEDTANMIESAKSGATWRAISETPFTPIAARNAMRGIELWQEGQRTRSGKDINYPGKQGARKIDSVEAFRKALLGLQPTSVSSGYGAYRATSKMKTAITAKKTKWADRFVNALRRKDKDEREKILKEINAWNKKAIAEKKYHRVVDVRAMIKSRLRGNGLSSIPKNMRREALKIANQWQ